MNYKIIIEYDGSPYHGWQVQNDRKTVQAELERALSKVLNQAVKVIGSGRTDAGVHAMGQAANFHADTRLACDAVKKGANSLMKGPVIIRELTRADENFHARYDAVSKEYHYYILNRDPPCAIGRNYVWHVRNTLDITRMQKCCDLIVGKHDFKSFEGTGSPRSTTVRQMFSATVRIKENAADTIVFQFRADGFLRFMVRNLVGTLVLAGLSKIDLKEFKTILAAKQRKNAGPTAPAHGLFLMRVDYGGPPGRT